MAMLEQLRAGLAGRYEVEREIGSGGMALVFLARDVKHHRPVALKVLRPEVGGAVGASRFLREIEIAARLSHPHILPLHDSGETNGLTYYVMPFVDGETLRTRLAREHQLPIHEALRIANDVAGALAYAHASGVLHRDIKPENILLSAGHALVADFGIARALSAAGGDKLTGTGVAVGTVYYMSPEQAFGSEAVDGRSDIYSLGTVLFEMLAGRGPFVGKNAQAVLAQIVTANAPAVGETREGIPPGVERIVQRMLAIDPNDRFATAADLATAISAVTTGPTSATVSAPHPSRRSRNLRIGVAAATAIVLAAAVWALAGQRGGGGSRGPANRIAVLPFAIHGGGQLDYLGEGVVDLLSRNLEGVDDLQTVDPGTVITAVHHGRGTASMMDVDAGRAVVGRVGAGGFVLGSVNSSGSRMRIQAAMYDADGRESEANASVEGDTAQLLELVDKLAGELLVKRRPGAQHRLIQTALLTTHSLPALKWFLNAEQSLRRRQLDSAIAGYQRAIAEDSTFALAYYRLAVAAGWSDRHTLSTDAATRALSVNKRLSPREKRLVSAYDAFRRGDADTAERQYRAVLEDFPDDLEAEFQLGDVLYQYNPLRGRPRLEARPMLDRVLAHDPGFL
ncbi:MAG: protein kinase [Gemmatimonadaceae bacterium]